MARRAVILLALFSLLCAVQVQQTDAFWSSWFKKSKGDKPTHYWYNEVTKASQWETPLYEFKNEEGTSYFMDPDTNTAVWEKPASLQWTPAVDEQTGNVYYVNEVTKATQWEKPTHLAWVQVENDKTEL